MAGQSCLICIKDFGFPPQHQGEKKKRHLNHIKFTNSQNKVDSPNHKTTSSQADSEMREDFYPRSFVFRQETVYLLPVPQNIHRALAEPKNQET